MRISTVLAAVASLSLLAFYTACPAPSSGGEGEGEGAAGEGEGAAGDGEGAAGEGEGAAGEGEGAAGEGEGAAGEGEGEGGGVNTVSWTSNGTAQSTALLSDDVVTVSGSGGSADLSLTIFGHIDANNSVIIGFIGALGDTTIPAGTYDCTGAFNITSNFDGHTAQAASSVAGSSCSITFDQDAVNGGAFTGTFSGTLKGQNGGPDDALTNGSFDVNDTP